MNSSFPRFLESRLLNWEQFEAKFNKKYKNTNLCRILLYSDFLSCTISPISLPHHLWRRREQGDHVGGHDHDHVYHDGDHAHDMDGGEDDNDGEISYSSDEPPRPDRGFNSPFDAKHSCRHWKVKTILTISQLLSSS